MWTLGKTSTPNPANPDPRLSVPALPPPPPPVDWALPVPLAHATTECWPELRDVAKGDILTLMPRSSLGDDVPSVVVLVGVVHGSTASRQAVSQTIRAVRPQHVVVELCGSRSGALGPNQQAVRGMGVAAAAFAAGDEMLEAKLAADAVGAQTVLGDRPIEMTMRRCWAAMSARARARAVWGLLNLALVGRKGRRTLVDEALALASSGPGYTDGGAAYAALDEVIPGLIVPLLEERDAYLAWSCARSKAVRRERNTDVVVGVVGKAHLRGMVHALTVDPPPGHALTFSAFTRAWGTRSSAACAGALGEWDQGWAAAGVDLAFEMSLLSPLLLAHANLATVSIAWILTFLTVSVLDDMDSRTPP